MNIPVALAATSPANPISASTLDAYPLSDATRPVARHTGNASQVSAAHVTSAITTGQRRAAGAFSSTVCVSQRVTPIDTNDVAAAAIAHPSGGSEPPVCGEVPLPR